MFCEMLVLKCVKLKVINLITGENSMQNAFKELKISLQLHGIELRFNFYDFHDREIRFVCSLSFSIKKKIINYKKN